MGKRIVFVGAGALGGYVGGHLTRAGNDVTFIDSWPEHVESVKLVETGKVKPSPAVMEGF